MEIQHLQTESSRANSAQLLASASETERPITISTFICHLQQRTSSASKPHRYSWIFIYKACARPSFPLCLCPCPCLYSLAVHLFVFVLLFSQRFSFSFDCRRVFSVSQRWVIQLYLNNYSPHRHPFIIIAVFLETPVSSFILFKTTHSSKTKKKTSNKK